jgi:hypothetical protein
MIKGKRAHRKRWRRRGGGKRRCGDASTAAMTLRCSSAAGEGPCNTGDEGEGEVRIIYRGRAWWGGAHQRDGVAAAPRMLFGEQQWLRGARRTKGKGGVLGRPWSALVVEILHGDGGGWWWGSRRLEPKWGEEKEGVGGPTDRARGGAVDGWGGGGTTAHERQSRFMVRRCGSAGQGRPKGNGGLGA